MKLFGTMKAENGILEIGGIKVTELAEKYGTPLYIILLQIQHLFLYHIFQLTGIWLLIKMLWKHIQ